MNPLWLANNLRDHLDLPLTVAGCDLNELCVALAQVRERDTTAGFAGAEHLLNVAKTDRHGKVAGAAYKETYEIVETEVGVAHIFESAEAR